MKKAFVAAALLLLSCSLLMADFPGVKFVAPMDILTGPVEGPWILTIMATSTQTIDVMVDVETEIEDEQGEALSPDGLAALPEGTIVKVAGVFMEDGLYARGVDVVKSENEFEFKGPADSVDCGSGALVLMGFEITLTLDTEIRGADGDLLTCEDIEPGQFLKVEGMATDAALIAEKIKVGIPGKEHLVVEFDAVVQEMAGSEWLVAVGGNNPGATVPVLVVLDENTQVIGTIEVGTEVEITGVLTPELAVLARLIKIEGIRREDKGDSGKKEGDVEDDESGDGDVENSGKKDDNPGKKDDNPGKKDNPPGKDKDKSDKSDDDPIAEDA